MKRSVALLGLVLIPLVGFVPAAEATGAAACTISGTMNFAPSPLDPQQGTWTIDPAVIECHGLFKGVDRITGPGSFSGAGAYTTLPTGSAACVHHIGTGTVDYVIPTVSTDVHLIEPHDFVLLGAGAFATPSLRGSFQLTPPYDDSGNCVTKPLTRALFLAQATLVRITTTPS